MGEVRDSGTMAAIRLLEAELERQRAAVRLMSAPLTNEDIQAAWKELNLPPFWGVVFKHLEPTLSAFAQMVHLVAIRRALSSESRAKLDAVVAEWRGR